MRTKAVFCLSLMFMAGMGCFNQPAQAAEVKSVDGQIADVDWVSNAIIVRWLNTQNDQFRETTFIIDQDVKIKQGVEELDFSDLKRGDQVTVVYRFDMETGDQKVLRVTVLVEGLLPGSS